MNASKLACDKFAVLFGAHNANDERDAAQQQKHALKRDTKYHGCTIAWLTFLLVLAGASGMRAQDTSIPKNAIINVHPTDTERTTFQRKSALLDASLFLAVEHGFRLLQDPLVRHGLRGPFFEDYANSIKNIHGWDDGDPFFVNCVGHPTQGAVAGFIEIHNDPQYRNVEFGASPRYWKSRFRAMAFSAVYSLQFEIGPVSEAPIGNSQLTPPNVGVIDWVITPTLGKVWVVGEDLTDKYLIRKIEHHTRSVPLMAVAGTFLSPCRGMSNIVGRRAPWHRDDRPGIRSVASELR